MFTMLTPCCISLLQVSQFRLSDLLLGSGRKVVIRNQAISILYHIQHIQNHKGALLLRNMFLGKTPFYLCGVLLVLTISSSRKAPLPPNPRLSSAGKDASPAALQHTACQHHSGHWEDLFLLERFVRYHPLPKPSYLLFLRAVFIHQGQGLGWRKGKRRPFSTIRIVSQG